MNYLDIDEILYIHSLLINHFWWFAWIKNRWQLESVLAHIENDTYYKLFIDKLVHLFHWIIQFHCFNDWNKRTAIAATHLFLIINWYEIQDFVVKMEDIAVWVAKWTIWKEDLKKIFNSILSSFWY